MISSALVSTSPPSIINTCPTPRKSSIGYLRLRKSPVVCFNYSNPRGGHRDPVLVVRKSTVKKRVEEEKGIWRSEVGFKEMMSFCGLGYWVCGFRCFPWLALNIHMAQNLNMHPSALQLVQHSANLPMVAKPLYGVLSDALHIGGAHRVPYVCIGAILQILAWVPLALIPGAARSLTPLMALILLSNLGASITKVAKDALVAEYGKKS